MSNLKTYRVSYEDIEFAEVTLQVDHDVLTPALATEINDFWGMCTHRLSAQNGDVVQTVIRMFGVAAINRFLAIGGGDFVGHEAKHIEYWTQQVIDHEGEGWPPLAELGILLIRADVHIGDYFDATLEAL